MRAMLSSPTVRSFGTDVFSVSGRGGRCPPAALTESVNSLRKVNKFSGGCEASWISRPADTALFGVIASREVEVGLEASTGRSSALCARLVPPLLLLLGFFQVRRSSARRADSSGVMPNFIWARLRTSSQLRARGPRWSQGRSESEFNAEVAESAEALPEIVSFVELRGALPDG